MPLINGLHIRLLIETPHYVYSNTFYGQFDGSAPATAAGMQSLANAIFTEAAGVYAPCLHTSVKIRNISLRYRNGSTDLEAISSTGAVDGNPAAILANDHVLPDEVCLCIQRRTGKAGRSKRGRVFISGMPESFQDHSHIAAAYASPALAIAGWMANDMELSFTENEVTTNTVVHHRHWDRKNNVLEPVMIARPLAMLMSRRERRGHGQGLVVTFEE